MHTLSGMLDTGNGLHKLTITWNMVLKIPAFAETYEIQAAIKLLLYLMVAEGNGYW